jgi:hypothetical protein
MFELTALPGKLSDNTERKIDAFLEQPVTMRKTAYK